MAALLCGLNTSAPRKLRRLWLPTPRLVTDVGRPAAAAGGAHAVAAFGRFSTAGLPVGQLEAQGARHRELGPVDILVANAGASLTPPALLEETPEDGFRASVEANLIATFLTIKSFLPGMKKRGSGNIITISSAAGRRPHPRAPIPYAAAKAGIELMTQTVAAQAGPHGVRANCIAPDTIMTKRNTERIPAEQIQPMIDSHPLKRLGKPDDIAQAALFLASNESSWISGVILDVAGGATMVR